MSRVFLLSPAQSGGKRAAMLTRECASFELARQVQIGAATLGDVFSFCSGLYFRGKLIYARKFAEPPPGIPGVQIITPTRGLITPEILVGPKDLSEFAAVPIDSNEVRFTTPLANAARSLLASGVVDIVLLGSVATGKYLDTLCPILGKHLLFPEEFAGRGDMSRGALLLRTTAENRELHYSPIPPPKRQRGEPAKPT